MIALGILMMAAPVSEPARPLSFRYEEGVAVQNAPAVRIHRAKVRSLKGLVYVYASFEMVAANPLAHADGQEQGIQTVSLGQEQDGEFVPVVSFGLQDDGRAPEGRAHLVPWLFDGQLHYYGAHARPNTPYDFKLRMDRKKQRMTAWVSGRGDDDWFLLAEDIPTANPIAAIDAVRAKQHPGAGGIHSLVIGPRRQPGLEAVRPHPLAKKEAVVGKGKGFRFQAMRSTWRRPGRHVTIARRPPLWMGFPDVVQTGPDTLVCTHNDGQAHGGGGSLLVRHSSDLGRTWSEPTAVCTGGVNCPRLQKLKDGTLLLCADVDGSSRIVFYNSADGGKTWINERFLVPSEAGGSGSQAYVPSRVLELPDGAWLLGASWYPGGKPYTGTEGEQLEFFRSEDRGRTWAFLSSLRAYPPHSLSEPSLLLLPDGKLLVYAREARYDGMPGIKAFSRDGGRTWEARELPFIIHGRTCAAFLRDGRVMLTFRAGIGRQALWAWVGDAEDPTAFQPSGVHFNDRHSVGLKGGALHIDSDGARGQFTQYCLRPADSPDSAVEVTVEVKALSNSGKAATLSIPFTGLLRFFPDRAEMAHDPALRVPVTPGEFHTYRIVSRAGRMTLYVDGRMALQTENTDRRAIRNAWTPAQISVYSLAFGNERSEDWLGHDGMAASPDIWDAQITREVTGYSLWRRVEAVLEDPRSGTHRISWSAAQDGFPDRYQSEHTLEVEASVAGHDQGYSGWVELADGRILVLTYTDDTAPVCPPSGGGRMGIAWIRGTYLLPSDLPKRGR